jgi:hypothetical protein
VTVLAGDQSGLEFKPSSEMNMKQFVLQKPDGSEVSMDQDRLVIAYNNNEIDISWLARPDGTSQWERVGTLLSIASSSETGSNSSSGSNVAVSGHRKMRLQKAAVLVRYHH